MKTKHSVGIICCKVNGIGAMARYGTSDARSDARGLPQCLFICKRYTYAYNSFVHGNYRAEDLPELFSKMTIDEKLDILSFNFDQIWYRVWLNTTKGASFAQSKARFEKLISCVDLPRVLRGTTNGKRLWEVPKGQKKFKKESDIACAIREFNEESGVNKKQYKIYNNRIQYSYIDGGIKYINTYYIAVTKYNIEPQLKISDAGEVSDVRWLGLPAVAELCPELHFVARRAIAFVKKQTRI